MLERLPQDFDRTNALIALGVWLVTVIVYTMTQAVTVSFWDCGEFVACSCILGIPHPPGTPLFIMAGRLFSLLPFFTDAAARVTFLSAVCSSIATLFGYLCAVRILRTWFKADRSFYSRLLIYAGAACGALLLAFGRTQWNNSVEAEVYGMSMMVMMGILWLTLIYFEKRGTMVGDRIMLTVVYLAFLGIGVHMTTFLILPVCALVFVLKKKTPMWVWFTLGIFFLVELFLIFALSSRSGEIPYYLPIVIVFLLYVFYILSFEHIPRLFLLYGLGFLVSCVPAIADFSGAGARSWTLLGETVFCLLFVYSLYELFRYFRRRKNDRTTPVQGAVAASFVIAAAVLSAVLMSGIKGYHSFLIISVAVLVILGLLVWRHIRLPILLALAATSLIIIGVREFFFGGIIAAVLILLLGIIWRFEGWKTALLVIVMAMAGFSIHIFVPVRSSLQPSINENNPSQSLDTTINFLERKQYGSMSMTERMFTRRAEWENQFGTYRRMGFWGFFQEQYGFEGRRFLVLFIIGMFGIWEACRRKPEVGLVLVILLLVSTVGLILYMNFADGSRINPVTGGDYLEVRDRDYFFTPGFMLFGLAVGLGISGLIQYLRDMFRKSHPVPGKVVLAVLPILFLLPVNTIAANYFFCDRSKNYMAYDYAWNILISADENAVVFTNGDNDTFPVWCLQEAYGIRKDVKIINLSLGNTDWYIKQVRDKMGLELGWTDAEIDALRPYRYPDGRTFRVQDQLVDRIIQYNANRIPIDYSVTVSSGARKFDGCNIDTLLEMHGLIFRLTDSAAGDLRVDIERSVDFFTNPDKFKYRSLDDPSVYKDETAHRLSRNVGSTILLLAEALRNEGKMEQAVGVVQFAAQKIPFADDVIEILAALYARQGKPELLVQLLDDSEYGGDSLRIRVLLARAYRIAKQEDKAEAVLTDLLGKHPSCRDALDELMSMYITQRDLQKMLLTLQSWVRYNPDDLEVRGALQDLVRSMAEAQQKSAGDSL